MVDNGTADSYDRTECESIHDMIPTKLWPVETVGIVFMLFVMGTIFFGNVFTFIILRKTRQLPFAIKWLTPLTILFDSTFLLMNIICHMLNEFTELDSAHLMIAAEFGRIPLAMSWITVTIIVLERFMCLYWPNVYALHVREERIRAITLTCLFVCSVVITTTKIFLLLYLKPESSIADRLSRGSTLLTLILALCMLIGLVCYIGIFTVVKKQTASIVPLYSVARIPRLNIYRSTKLALIIFLVFISVYLPLLVIMLYKHMRNDTDLQLSVFVCGVIMCSINPVLYVWRLKECRYLALAILSRHFKCCTMKVEIMRCEIYNIVLTTTTTPHV